MAKRNLARTAIEGGRVSNIRVDERFSTRAERQRFRAVAQSIKKDPDSADELFVDGRKATYKEFADKLNPVYRWLEKQNGRHWNEVYSEIRSKFPGRSLAGRHIIGHIEGFISMAWHEHGYKGGLVVGEDGILKKVESRRRHYYHRQWEVDPELISAVHKLLETGWHGELNRYLKKHHSIFPLVSVVKPRLLAGKHDVEQFVKDILRGSVDPKVKEHHPEWRKNLNNFIERVLSKPGPMPGTF